MVVMLQKPELAIIVLFLFFAGGGNNAQENNERRQGYLVGSMLYVSGDERSGDSLGDAAEVTVELEHKGRIVRLTSNQQGDYILSMAKGKYCLKSALAADSRFFKFFPASAQVLPDKAKERYSL